MKKALIFSLILVSAFLFTKKALALTLQDSFIVENTFSYQCNEGWTANNFVASSSYSITQIDVNLDVPSTTDYIVSLRTTDVNSKPTGSDLFAVQRNLIATTTTSVWYEFQYPQGYQLDSGTKYAIVMRPLDIPCDGAPYTNYVKPRVNSLTGSGTHASSNSGSTWSADYQGGLYRTYSGSIYTHPGNVNTSALTFESPPANSQWRVGQNIPFFGFCTGTATSTLRIVNDAVNVQNCGASSCTYEDFLVEDIPCIGGDWNIGLIPFNEPGHYFLDLFDGTNRATEYVNVDWTSYNEYPTSTDGFIPLPCEIVNWSCDLPLVGDFCHAGGTVVNWGLCYVSNTVRYNAEAVAQVKPYSYVFEIYDAFSSNLTSTTASTTLPSVSILGGSASIDIVTPASMFDQVPTTTWAFWRSVGDTVIKISFLGYIVALIL